MTEKNKYIKYIQGDFDSSMVSLKASLSNLLYGLLKHEITEYHLKNAPALSLETLSSIIKMLFKDILTDFWSDEDKMFMTITSIDVEDYVVVAEKENDGIFFQVTQFEDWKNNNQNLS